MTPYNPPMLGFVSPRQEGPLTSLLRPQATPNLSNLINMNSSVDHSLRAAEREYMRMTGIHQPAHLAWFRDAASQASRLPVAQREEATRVVIALFVGMALGVALTRLFQQE